MWLRYVISLENYHFKKVLEVLSKPLPDHPSLPDAPFYSGRSGMYLCPQTLYRIRAEAFWV